MSLSTLEKVLFLRGVELFDEVPSEELTPVAQIAQMMTIAKGERFIRQGDRGDCLYVLVEGEVSIVIDGLGEVARRGPRSVIGEMALIAHSPRSANCIALTDLTMLRVGREDFWALMEEHPELAIGANKVLARRLEEAVANLRRLGHDSQH